MICFFTILFFVAGLCLAFLILIHKLLQLLAEDPPVIAAHLCAADKICFRTLDADHIILLQASGT